jgi:aminoglycoside phosphotransferase
MVLQGNESNDVVERQQGTDLREIQGIAQLELVPLEHFRDPERDQDNLFTGSHGDSCLANMVLQYKK